MSELTKDRKRRVVIADEHPIVRHGLQSLLSRIRDVEIHEADSFDTLSALLTAVTVDLVLLDLKIPGTEGFSGLSQLRQRHPDLPVAIISGYSDAGVVQATLKLGAVAFIPKTLDIRELASALRMVLAGGVWSPTPLNNTVAAPAGDDPGARFARLTPQQRRVLGLIAQGRLNKQIAYELGMKEATVKGHVTTILLRLGLRRRTEAALLAQRMLQIS